MLLCASVYRAEGSIVRTGRRGFSEVSVDPPSATGLLRSEASEPRGSKAGGEDALFQASIQTSEHRDGTTLAS